MILLAPIQTPAQDASDYYRQNCLNCHTIGGVGTFPSLIFAGMFKDRFPAAPEIATIALLMRFLTEVTSNASTTTMMLPVLAARVNLLQMGKTGLVLSLITVVFVTPFIYLWVAPVPGISVNVPPVWMD